VVDRPQPAKSLLFVEFFKKSPVLRQNPGETGSHMTAHTTIQSSRAAENVPANVAYVALAYLRGM
jgi:hypothetical protein